MELGFAIAPILREIRIPGKTSRTACDERRESSDENTSAQREKLRVYARKQPMTKIVGFVIKIKEAPERAKETDSDESI